ncbi:hypothetical protein ES703_79275 [subsurface metagenome]
MSPNIEFGFDSQIFDPPAPVISVELRSPAHPIQPNPGRLPALIDTGADGSSIPQIFVDSLHLSQVDEIKVGAYDDKPEDYQLKPVYSIHLTIAPLEPIIARVTPKDIEAYMIIGRSLINDWLLTLDGPKLKGYLKLDH